MNDLYYPQKPKSKLEEYNLKLKERELYTNNILDRFIENGSGAPRHDKYGNLQVKKKTVFKDEFDDENIILDQNNNAPSFPINGNIPNDNNFYNTISNSNKINQNIIQNNLSENVNTNPRFYQSFSNRRGGNLNIDNINNNAKNILNKDIVNSDINQSYDNINNNNNTNALNQNQLMQMNQNQNYSNINNNNRNIDNYSNQEGNSTNYSNISYNNMNRRKNYNNGPYGDNYQGLGILPHSNESKRERMIREEAFKDTLLREMEEKKMQKELEKQKEKDLDLKAELKLQKELEEEKQQVLLEKQRKGAIEQKMMEENRINMQKSKKKKNLIDIDEYYNKNIILKNHRAYVVDNKNKNKKSNSNDNNANTDNSNNANNANVNSVENNVYANVDINYRNSLNALQNINNIRQETLNNINNFNINVDNRENNDIDDEIFQLKNEVRNQYMEMNDLFDQLKYGITEAEQYKKGRENESKILKEELFKNRTAQKLSDNILERDYEQNMNLNYDELVDNNINTIDSNTNLQGKSQWEYINKEENENRNNLSSLAKAGKSIVELTGENDFIPISSNVANDDNDMNGLDINRIDLMNEERKIEEDHDKKGIMQFKREMEIENLLNDNSGKGCTMEDLYKELDIIQNINHGFSPINKIETLRNNFEYDYGSIKNKEKKNLKSKFKK